MVLSRCCGRLRLLNRDAARAEMARDKSLPQFAREAYEGLVKEYRGAAQKALGHAAYLKLVREM